MTDCSDHTAGVWQLEEVPCDYCGSWDSEVLLTGWDRLHGLPGRFNVVLCRQCGLARTNPRPTPASLPTAYPDQYEQHQDATVRARPPGRLLRWVLTNWRGYPLGRRWPAGVRHLFWPVGMLLLRRRRARRYIPYVGQGRLLDFGCGTGEYVAKMAAVGWQAEGMDLSARAVGAGRRAGLNLHQGTLPGTELPAESFDAVSMWQALEHVPSPMATLRAVAEILRPGGLLVIACPRLDSLPARWFGSAWHDLELPRHLTHFTAKTLRRHLEAAGFESVRCWNIRRPSGIRQSFAFLAEETGRALHRSLARSRAAVGLMSWTARLAGRASQILCLGRKPQQQGQSGQPSRIEDAHV